MNTEGKSRYFTPAALALTIALLVSLGVWALVGGSSMFSSGGLNAQSTGRVLGGVASHAQLGSNCVACHASPLGSDTMAARCLVCHSDVSSQIQTHSGLHGSVVATVATGTCRGCHTEHNGATGALTVLDSSFPHDATGFSLAAHSSEGVSCSNCHGRDLTSFQPGTCVTCHKGLDSALMTGHIATFGSSCVPCHDGVDRYGQSFDHNKLAFKLTGSHAGLSCASCHKAATTVEALKATPADCFSCHKKDDAHQGQFGQQCGQCHTPTSWSDATFDHSKTVFPLTGAHAKVACAQCHAGQRFAGTPTDCVSCHAQPAFHADAFDSESTKCASCHTTAGWEPATFALAHDIFPINHGNEEQQSTCKTCHTTKVSSYTCLGCHAHAPDRVVAEHEGRSLAELQDCIRCHAGGRGGGD